MFISLEDTPAVQSPRTTTLQTTRQEYLETPIHTIAMSSTAAQVTATMAQMHAIGSLEAQNQWLEYVHVLSHVLGDDLVDAEAAYSCLEESLLSTVAFQALHEMLMEEFMENRARTLVPALATAYPWDKMTTEMSDAFMAFAQWRERAMSRSKDEPAAREHAAYICQEILRQSSSQDDSLINEDPLASQLQQLFIRSNDKNGM
jgi:hypothetical protein